jgi:predicted DNA-binding transcriptional regulator YafY
VALLFTLQRRRSATAAELAEDLGVSERTMHRDIASLQAAGVPLWTEPGRHGGVRLVDGWRSRLDGLTSREAVAIFAMGVPRALTELGLGTAVSAAHAKVAATLPAALREQAQLVAGRFHLDAPGWFRQADETAELATVAKAVWEQRRLRVDYRRDQASVRRELDPLGLVLKAGVWYLVARVEETIRTYRVGRIVSCAELDERFERPADFDLAGWWQRSSTQFERSVLREHARVRLSPHGLRRLSTVFGADVAATVLPDGTPAAGTPDNDGWIELDLPIETHDIAVSQLVGLGAEVEVLQPASLRAALAELGAAIAARNGVPQR